MSRRMPKTLQSWLIPKLRRISLMWIGKSIAREKARVIVEDGVFKNGNTKTKVLYKCNGCQDLYEKEETQADHIIPCVDVSGFTDWNDYMNRLFCQPEGYQILCKSCHISKTLSENQERFRIKHKK